MGMSASQARLIQLTARMSDLELEGQQLNQQRLNLANQISAVSEEALRMEVPTSPNPMEFMEEGYAGTDPTTKEPVGVQQNPDGSFTVNVPANVDTFKAADEVEAQEVKSTAVEKPEAHNSIQATYTPEKKLTGYEYDNERHTEADKVAEEQKRKKAKEDAEAAVNKKQDAEPKETNTKYHSEEDVYDSEGNKTGTEDVFDSKTYNSDYSTWQSELKELQTTANNATNDYNTVVAAPAFDYYELDEGKTATVTSQDGASDAVMNYHPHGINNTNAQGDAIKYTYTDSFGIKKEGDVNALTKASSGYSSDQIKDLCKLYKEDGTQIKNPEDFDTESGRLKYNGNVYSEPAKEKIGDGAGGQLYSIDEAKSKFADDTKFTSDFMPRLKQAIIADLGLSADDALKTSLIEAEYKNWRVQQTSSGYTAYKIGADGKAQMYKNATDAGYQEYTGGKGKFSSTGSLQTVSYTDSNGASHSINAQKTSELNNEKYGAAVAKYTNDKAAYDHAQEEFNQKTKKLQNIDKQLELKLKRLDTERNALNTEIDAVKKVIQDNTDKSFKTFSG